MFHSTKGKSKFQLPLYRKNAGKIMQLGLLKLRIDKDSVELHPVVELQWEASVMIRMVDTEIQNILRKSLKQSALQMKALGTRSNFFFGTKVGISLIQSINDDT